LSDGCVVAANQGHDAAAVRERVRRHFLPYHRAVARRIAAFRRAGRVPAVISIHSFTPRMDGLDRPWQVGVLWRHDRRIAAPVLAALRARGDLVVGDNQPYSGLGEFGFTIEFHTQRTRLPHVMFEVRQDEIDTREGAERYAAILADALEGPLADPGLYALLPREDVPDTPGLEGISWRHGSRL
jgi:predicted N-formylglutamate amidohydrolase